MPNFNNNNNFALKGFVLSFAVGDLKGFSPESVASENNKNISMFCFELTVRR